MIKPVDKDTAIERLERLCVKAERCEYELRLKLAVMGLTADADEVLDHLRRHHFVDDSRFAEAFVRDKYRFNLWGRIKIRNALRLKRISSDIINSALAAIDQKEYLDILRGLVRARIARGDDRNTIVRSLYSRGFEPDITAAVISGNK